MKEGRFRPFYGQRTRGDAWAQAIYRRIRFLIPRIRFHVRRKRLRLRRLTLISHTRFGALFKSIGGVLSILRVYLTLFVVILNQGRERRRFRGPYYRNLRYLRVGLLNPLMFRQFHLLTPLRFIRDTRQLHVIRSRQL